MYDSMRQNRVKTIIIIIIIIIVSACFEGGGGDDKGKWAMNHCLCEKIKIKIKN